MSQHANVSLRKEHTPSYPLIRLKLVHEQQHRLLEGTVTDTLPVRVNPLCLFRMLPFQIMSLSEEGSHESVND
jgi:hypothetical protein